MYGDYGVYMHEIVTRGNCDGYESSYWLDFVGSFMFVDVHWSLGLST